MNPVPTSTITLENTNPATILHDWLRQHPRILVLTGAGVSTAAGIPDYRDNNGAWKRSPPVTYQAFTRSENTYQRYWARSFVGWTWFSQARPTTAHVALAALETSGKTSLLVTQNVDGLHQQAGSRNVLDLHGRLDHVVCLQCRRRTLREALQHRMQATNPNWMADSAATAPDGDADIPDGSIAHFTPPHCDACEGLLKPDVVFFGENVPPERPRQVLDALQTSDAMLVVGSSLMVHSGFRYAQAARNLGLPLAILGLGHTRADGIATLKMVAECGETLNAAIGAT